MPAPTIVTIRPGVQFTSAAAASFLRAEAGWRAKSGRAQIDVNSTYRDYDKQLRMFNAWERYRLSGFNPALYPGHSRALHPDKSMHCKALALDSDDWTRPGFIAHMAEHGWIRTAAGDPTEQHHFEYQSWRDQHRNSAAGIESKPFIDYGLLRRQKEPSMYVRGTTNKTVVYNVFTDANGAVRMRLCGKFEAAYAFAGGLVVTGDDATLTGMGVEGQYRDLVVPEVTIADADG